KVARQPAPPFHVEQDLPDALLRTDVQRGHRACAEYTVDLETMQKLELLHARLQVRIVEKVIVSFAHGIAFQAQPLAQVAHPEIPFTRTQQWPADDQRPGGARSVLMILLQT